jgi:branched-chain amino acid transport system permease protein
LRGTLIGGIVLGVVQALGALISPQISILAGHLVFLAVLGWRLMQTTAADRGGWRTALAALLNKPDPSRRKA